MAAKERNVVTQRQQLGLDRCDQRRMVAIREVGSPDRTLEQHVAHQSEPCRFVDEDQVTGRMTRAVQHVEAVGAEHQDVAFGHPAVRRDVAGLEPIGSGLFRDAIEKELVA